MDELPSGDWTGYYIQWGQRSRQDMFLSFTDGRVSGAGADPVAAFNVRGGYDPESGRVWMTKSYPGAHQVHYLGARDGRGIAGRWEISGTDTGTFRLWPVAYGEGEAAVEEVEEPVLAEIQNPNDQNPTESQISNPKDGRAPR